MFFKPNRNQAIAIQDKLKIFYEEIGGEYYAGEDAWNYIKKETGVNLKFLLEQLKE